MASEPAIDLAAATNEEIDRLVAERVMGWTWDSERNCYRDLGGANRGACWNPADDHNDAALMRAEIERRGVLERFVLALTGIVIGKASLHWLNVWALINATPRQQCEAALAAIEENAS